MQSHITGSSLWQYSDKTSAARPAFTQDKARCDLLVIGGGFTGCAAALEAAKSGARVLLLDANSIGYGGSGRNVGLVNAGLWLPPDDIVAEIGEDAARRLIHILADGPSSVFSLIEEENIHCDATRNGTLHLAHAPAGVNDLMNRYDQGIGTGAPLQLLDKAATEARTGSTAFHGALFDPRAGVIQPLAYCRGLAAAAERAGAHLYENSPVTGLYHDNSVWQVKTASGVIQADKLLVATNAYHIPGQGFPHKSWARVSYSQFATAPLPADMRKTILPGGEGCWDTALIMTSVRMDAAGRLVIGGIGDLDGPGSDIHAAWARRKLVALYPDLADMDFDYCWQGNIAMTRDHIPKIRAFGPNAFSIFGYSGRGIAPGTVFGRRTAQALLTGDHSVLPVEPVHAYEEGLQKTRAAWCEFGAIATHAVQPSPIKFG